MGFYKMIRFTLMLLGYHSIIKVTKQGGHQYEKEDHYYHQ